MKLLGRTALWKLNDWGDNITAQYSFSLRTEELKQGGLEGAEKA